MSVQRWKQTVALMPLLALLVSVLPYRSIAVQASSVKASSVAAALATQQGEATVSSAAEDAALVRATLQHPIQDAQFYFVLPDRFDNADPGNDRGSYGTGDTDADVLRHGYRPSNKAYYHGGDFKGLMARLDYLQGMGINAIWMTPIFKNRPVQCGAEPTVAACSAGYHGYWITDFTQVDPHLGTNQELTELVEAAHARGMKVFFDIITNHTADVIDYAEGPANNYRYISKANEPYKDANGNVFDDRDYAGTDNFPPLDPEISFPYTPIFRSEEDKTVKTPGWLNDPTYYHNRGNSTFSGESAEYGDFVQLDDLFTEHPDVVKGMTEIYQTWITDFNIDGYRIDTVKHVNMEFWEYFAKGIRDYATAHNKPDFFMYGEIFDGNPAFVSQYTTRADLPAALDFPFQGTARGFASQSQPTNNLTNLFAADDYYTDESSNAYHLPTFLGNHDMGRFGFFLQRDNPGASDTELLQRDRLGHALMYFSRGMPVVYYGDEQGFTGDGGDQDARQDMMPSEVGTYNDDDLIGTGATPAAANFDHDHPLYQTLRQLSQIRQAHRALNFGAQITRYSSDQAGIFAFSRVDREEQIEYVVAFNNAETEQTATFKTYHVNGTFSAVPPMDGGVLTTDANGNITVTVPALSFVIYRANQALPQMTTAPDITLNAPTANESVTGRVEVAAQLNSDRFAEVSFGVKVGDAAEYTYIGTDNNPLGPGQNVYRVFYDVSQHPAGTPISFKAVVNDPTDDTDGNFGALNSATVNVIVGQDDPGGGQCPAPGYAVIHYQRPAGDYEGWGLHLWGDAIDPSEGTEWASPKLPNGEDDYGVFWYIKLADATQPLNFIVHKGDEKDTPNDRSFIPAQSPEVWLMQNDATNHGSAVAAQEFVRIHYQRPGGDYEGWGLHLWGDAIDPSEGTEWATPKQPTGTDAYGVYFDVRLADATQPLNFVVHKGDEKDIDADRSFIPTSARTGDVWLKQGDAEVYLTQADAENVAIIHYRRPAGDYGDATSTNFADYWGLHVWAGAATPTEWSQPLKPAGQDRFGVYFRVPLAEGATELAYIIHKGDEKDLPEDQVLDLATYGNEVWVLQSTLGYLLPLINTCQPAGDRPGGNLNQAAAHWLSEDTIAWNVDTSKATTYKLHYAANGGITLDNGVISGGQSINLTLVPGGFSKELKAKFPHLADYAAFKVSANNLAQIKSILKGQIAVSAAGQSGTIVDATSVQIAGVLDDLFSYNGALGVTYSQREYQSDLSIRVWAPTAKSVVLRLFDNSTTDAFTSYPMTEDTATGVWHVQGNASWTNKYYLFEVDVYVPAYVTGGGQVTKNLVTDPYSVSLSMNSKRSQIVNLADPRLQPEGWNALQKPEFGAPEDIVLYELHVRDFSISDPKVPEQYKGKFKAFTVNNSNGMRHLKALADAGLTHLHLLPAFDCGTINENPAERREPDPAVLASFPPNSAEQRAYLEQFRDTDAFNWCYDPFHYTAPEGSYATEPDGVTRILEFREMVQSLNQNGLRVVMDVVYNHTTASGLAEKSVLDKVVPGYYHRLNPVTGAVEKSTCCENTATEHNMMEKLMLDSLVTWATAYKVDGFRFDLMGHHMKRNMEQVRDTLHSLTMMNDGVDGSDIYIYGEGWNFGEVENNKRGVNATQLNMAGTGIGTFNDRLRDAVRGGGPFDTGEGIVSSQGFATGLYYDPNRLNQGDADELQRLRLYQDQIRVGAAGNLRDYMFLDRNGTIVKGSQVDYNGSPTGYTADPQEVINYVEAHDNQTFWDIMAYKTPIDTSMAERVRIQNLGNSVVMFAQGIPFFHAGQDMLRSKSLDRNSYNSGDWFNRLDFTYETNNWGVGLPPKENDQDEPIQTVLLGNSALKPTKNDILKAVEYFREILSIRKSSELFRLETAEEIMARVRYHNTGPNQLPGLIVMSISDYVGPDLDSNYEQIVVVFNANDEAQTFTDDSFVGTRMDLHPIQKKSADEVVRTASFNDKTGAITVPARTTAVFVVKQTGNTSAKMLLPAVYK